MNGINDSQIAKFSADRHKKFLRKRSKIQYDPMKAAIDGKKSNKLNIKQAQINANELDPKETSNSTKNNISYHTKDTSICTDSKFRVKYSKQLSNSEIIVDHKKSTKSNIPGVSKNRDKFQTSQADKNFSATPETPLKFNNKPKNYCKLICLLRFCTYSQH